MKTIKNIDIDVDGLIKTLDLKMSGNRGWYSGRCVYCGKEDHMGVQLMAERKGFQCFKCGEKGGIVKLLKHIGRTDLITSYKSVDTISIEMSRFDMLKQYKEEEQFQVEESKLPNQFQYVDYHPYLAKRGFTPEQYNIFSVGISDSYRFKDRVIFVVKEDGVPKGYLGRSLWSNDAIKRHNSSCSRDDKHRKYLNSVTDFGKLVFGIDEINENTKIVIVVEGVTDKAAVDRALDLYLSDDIKCVCTFGKSFHNIQVKKIRRKGGNIKELAIFYDPDAIQQSYKYAAMYAKYFDSISVMIHAGITDDFTKYYKIDAGDMSDNDIKQCFSWRMGILQAQRMSKYIDNKSKLYTNG